MMLKNTINNNLKNANKFQTFDINDDVSPLQFHNFACLGSYIALAIVTFCWTYGGIGLTQYEILQEYQTLLSPSYLISSTVWILIFSVEGVYAILQLTPVYQNTIYLTSIWQMWVLTCLFQAIWSILQAQGHIWIAFFPITVVWFLLLGMNLTQSFLCKRICKKNAEKKLIDHFASVPLKLHLGWISAELLVNFNMVFLSFNVSTTSTLSVIFFSLTFLGVVLNFFKYQKLVSLILSFALLGIFHELQNPTNKVLNVFELEVISALKSTSLILSCLFFCLPIFVFWPLQHLRQIRKKKAEPTLQRIGKSEKTISFAW